MTQLISKQKKYNDFIILFASMMIYKIILEIGFWYVLQKVFKDLNVYQFEFSGYKYVIGTVWLIVIFFLIRHDLRKPSTFFLELHYVLAIIPITVIFAFSNENMLFYNAVCIGFSAACVLITLGKNIKIPKISLSTPLLIIAFFLITVVVYAGIVVQNGMFTLKALDIYQVYELREQFQLNKYIGYMFSWQNMVITPFFIIRFAESKKYICSLFFVGLQFIAYLYSAQKTILFIIPLTVGIYFISRLKKFNVWVFGLFAGGTVFVTLGSSFSGFIYNLYDLLIRRVLLLPADLKFIYYDFFSSHDKIGLAGTLWGKFLDIQHPYEEGIGNLISKVYFNKPDMNSNTGFIAEGYFRFDYFGILLVFILLAIVLWTIDYLAEQNGYSFAVCICLFSIFLLNDGGIIDPLIFGNLTVLILICLFYNKQDDFKKVSWKRDALKVKQSL